MFTGITAFFQINIDFSPGNYLHTLEGEGDRLFIQAMRRLHTEGSDSLEVIVWREIYIYLEKCCDACEHMANAAERVILKNT